MTEPLTFSRSDLLQPWALEGKAWTDLFLKVAAYRAAPFVIDAASVEPRRNTRQGLVAVIPVQQMLTPKMTILTYLMGGTPLKDISDNFKRAMADPDIGAIVFDIDSPGGQVDGIPELAKVIRDARGQKPMIAHANTMAASAAHWLATQADEFTVTESGTVGSIGVVAAHADFSKADEMEGVKVTFIHAGKYKVEGNPHEPLGEEARAAIQKDVDHYYGLFTRDVAKARGLPVETVRKGHGEARTLNAAEALEQGMVDRIETLDQAIVRAAMLARSQGRGAIAAEAFGSGIRSGFASVKDALQGLDKGDTVEPEGEATALVAGLPFAERLKLVAAEVEAIAAHAHQRVEMRKPKGKKLTGSDRDGLRRLLALRPVLDDIETLLVEPAEAEALEPASAVKSVLDLTEAYRRGYAIGDLMKGMITDGQGSGDPRAGAREAL